jgi:hypothetical protein
VSDVSLFTCVWTCAVGELRRVFVGCWIGSTIETVEAAANGDFEWTTTNSIVFGVGAVVAAASFVGGLYVGNQVVNEALADDVVAYDVEESEGNLYDVEEPEGNLYDVEEPEDNLLSTRESQSVEPEFGEGESKW